MTIRNLKKLFLWTWDFNLSYQIQFFGFLRNCHDFCNSGVGTFYFYPSHIYTSMVYKDIDETARGWPWPEFQRATMKCKLPLLPFKPHVYVCRLQSRHFLAHLWHYATQSYIETCCHLSSLSKNISIVSEILWLMPASPAQRCLFTRRLLRQLRRNVKRLTARAASSHFCVHTAHNTHNQDHKNHVKAGNARRTLRRNLRVSSIPQFSAAQQSAQPVLRFFNANEPRMQTRRRVSRTRSSFSGGRQWCSIRFAAFLSIAFAAASIFNPALGWMESEIRRGAEKWSASAATTSRVV